MTLDIVIPHYKEPWEVGRLCFEMLGLQRLVDYSRVNVYLVQDGEEGELPAELFMHYPYHVTQITIPHSGVSAARNAGMDAGAGDWIMFCDFDDSVFTTHTLFHIFDQIVFPNRDVVICEYESEEMDPDGTMWAKTHDGGDYVLLHGKVFRRGWLKEQNIRFDPNLTIHEDSYFVSLVRFLTPPNRIVYIREGPLYATYWNPNSVTRIGDSCVENKMLLDKYDEFFRKAEALVDELIRRRQLRYAVLMFCQTLCDTYVNKSRISWIGKDTGHLDTGARKFLQKYPDLERLTTENNYVEGVAAAREAIRKKHDLGAEKMSFTEWMNQIRGDKE